MIEFVSGAVAFGFVVGAVFFLRFWRQTGDRLFLAFAIAFALLALNQLFSTALEAGDERVTYTYILRVLGFVLILWAIVDKNLFARRGRGAGRAR